MNAALDSEIATNEQAQRTINTNKFNRLTQEHQ